MQSANQLQRFCPRCGKKTDKLINRLCPECFLETTELVKLPKELELIRCKRCGRIKFNNSWFEFEEELIEKILEKYLDVNENFKVESVDADFDEKKISVRIFGEVAGKQIEIRKTILLKFKEVLCEKCYKLRSNYYEAIIQLRAKDKETIPRLQAVVEEIKEFLASKSEEIVAIEKLKEGINLRIFSLRVAKKIAEFLQQNRKAELKRSASIVGMTKKGKPRKRVTFCIRL